MFCQKCGAFLQENSAFCHKCGAPLGIAAAIPASRPAKAGYRLRRGVVVFCLLLFVASIAAALPLLGRLRLQAQLMQDWENFESAGGTSYTLVLDFSPTAIQYRFESPYLIDREDSLITTLHYAVLSPKKVYIKEYDAVLDAEVKGDILYFSPALTGDRAVELWFRRD